MKKNKRKCRTRKRERKRINRILDTAAEKISELEDEIEKLSITENGWQIQIWQIEWMADRKYEG